MKSKDGDGVVFRRCDVIAKIAKISRTRNRERTRSRERYAVRGTRNVELKGALGVAAVVEL